MLNLILRGYPSKGNEGAKLLNLKIMRTIVKFLINTEGEVFAYFPKEKYSNMTGDDMKTGYAHIGQHTAVHKDYVRKCKQATKEQYSSLLNELVHVGYDNLKVINK